MCLSSKWIFPRKAKEDIVVYKEVCCDKEGNIYSPYMFTKIGNIKNLPISFKAKYLDIEERIESILFQNLKSIGAGYIHSYSFPYSTHYSCYSCMYKCIIPKGTKYHKSKDDTQYCSKKLIIIEKILRDEIYQNRLA